MRTLFIVNPAAGHDKCFKIWTHFEVILRENASFPFAVRLTRQAGDAELFAQIAIQEGYERIIAVGGDGTLNEVINGCINHTVHVGILPFGTGNDFAHALHIEKNHSALFQMLEHPQSSAVDIVKINDHYFINAAGIGMDGLVIQYLNKITFMKKIGKLGYVVSALWILFHFQPQNVTMQIDEQFIVFSNLWILAISNGPHIGGGMYISPDADISDGSLNLCVIQNLSIIQFLKFFPLVFSGRHIQKSRYVHMMKAKKMTFQVPESMAVQADGELINSSMVHIEIFPKKIQFITGIKL